MGGFFSMVSIELLSAGIAVIILVRLQPGSPIKKGDFFQNATGEWRQVHRDSDTLVNGRIQWARPLTVRGWQLLSMMAARGPSCISRDQECWLLISLDQQDEYRELHWLSEQTVSDLVASGLLDCQKLEGIDFYLLSDGSWDVIAQLPR